MKKHQKGIILFSSLLFFLASNLSLAYERPDSANIIEPIIKNQWGSFEIGYANMINSPLYIADAGVFIGSYGMEYRYNILFWLNGESAIGTNRPTSKSHRSLFTSSSIELLGGYSLKVSDTFSINLGLGFGVSLFERAFYQPIVGATKAKGYNNLILKIPFRAEFMYKITKNFEFGLVSFYKTRWQNELLKGSKWRLSHETGALVSFKTLF